MAKHDRHRQLINTAVYSQHSQARTKALEKTRQEQLQRKGEREKQKLRGHLNRIRGSASQAPYEVVVEGERYRVAAGGSKLVKITGEGERIRDRKQGPCLTDWWREQMTRGLRKPLQRRPSLEVLVSCEARTGIFGELDW